MRQPSPKLIVFFLLAMGAGYGLSYVVMTYVLDTPLRLYGFGNLTAIAFLFAVLMVIWLDKPFDLGFFKWPKPKPQDEQVQTYAQVNLEERDIQIHIPRGSVFPHEVPSEHWGVDFGDSKQVYQGAELPMWILAGWAIFIIWAIVYLISGLPTFHY